MSTTQPSNDVIHNEARHRFEFRDGSYVATLHYEHDGDHVTFTHTYVPDSLRGRGVATKLTRGALCRARQTHWKVTARCPFVAAFVEHNPEFADVVASQLQVDAEKQSAPDHTASLVTFEPETACDACGRFGAYRFSDRALCVGCFADCGSFGLESGRDDHSRR